MEVGEYDIAIVGGGPAGTAAAITASRSGLKTILFERGRYPRHKVCGEFISPESHQILVDLLGSNNEILRGASAITHARMFADGRSIHFQLPQPAWSIARHDLDAELWKAAEAAGAVCIQSTTVNSVSATGLSTTGTQVHATTIVNASGRWSNLRPVSPPGGPRWIGVKAHFSGEHAPPSTDIYFFAGGYCGIQPIGPNLLNASAMVRANVATSLEEVFAACPDLWLRSRAWEQATESITTSPLIHATPEPVTNNILNAGDAAGFVDPFVGDGISLALRSGVLAASCAGNPKRYATEYARQFSRVFKSAAMARRLVYAPQPIRRVAIFGFQSPAVRRWALDLTRGH
jgi:flavin-dependent dehydrogenase